MHTQHFALKWLKCCLISICIHLIISIITIKNKRNFHNFHGSRDNIFVNWKLCIINYHIRNTFFPLPKKPRVIFLLFTLQRVFVFLVIIGHNIHGALDLIIQVDFAVVKATATFECYNFVQVQRM